MTSPAAPQQSIDHAAITNLRRPGLWLAAGLFLLAYLAVGPVGDALSDRSMPLPDDSAQATADFYSANTGAVVAIAVLQVVSVVGLGLFVLGVARLLCAAREARKAYLIRWFGFACVAAMLVSSGIGLFLAACASSISTDTVGVLRQLNFLAGGVVNVVALGLFVIGASHALRRTELIGRVTMWLGYVFGGLAALSILSLVFYYANALLPAGRVLSMVWTVIAAVVLVTGPRVRRS